MGAGPCPPPWSGMWIWRRRIWKRRRRMVPLPRRGTRSPGAVPARRGSEVDAEVEVLASAASGTTNSIGHNCPGTVLVPEMRRPEQDHVQDWDFSPSTSAPGPGGFVSGWLPCPGISDIINPPGLPWVLDAPFCLELGMAQLGGCRPCSSPDPVDYCFWHHWGGTAFDVSPNGQMWKSSTYSPSFSGLLWASWLWRRKESTHTCRTNPAAFRVRAEGSGCRDLHEGTAQVLQL
ncbi:uncharacterized protein LOC113971458 [Neopelma chrysocephalum]|uniref:uncharacterized protein LOC113971458 n=1 Tax=Neopelma chrysocephalum TaxID=114329 RepID=UPI000FCD214A|nr:uncharacterized protein LOC113971458 [Neopelma chrysocephalum]